MSVWPNIVIDKFVGMDLTRNELSLLPGQLTKNENYLYQINGGLAERGGGAKLSDPPSTGALYGLGNYINGSSSEFLITVQGTDAYYYSSGWNALSLTLTSNKRMRFASAGASSSRALYGVNGFDSVTKISGTTPTGSVVASSPTTAVDIILHKNRLFAIDEDDTLYFTEAAAYDTWNTGSNTIEVAAGRDGSVKALAVWGDGLFIFKESAVYVIPNAADTDPTTNWLVLKTDAITGTNSPDSVKTTKDGIYFLGTDNVIRKIRPDISFSSGEYTLGGSGSPIVSHALNEELAMRLDTSNRGRAHAIIHKDLYILYWQSSDNTGTYNDRCFVADTSKFYQLDQVPTPQPYWSEITGATFDFAVVQFNSQFYGVGGSDGVTQRCFDDTVHNDAGNAIASKATLGWIAPGGEATKKSLKTVRFTGDVEDWAITLRFDGYDLDGEIPTDGSGTTKTFQPNSDTSVALVGSAVVGTDQTGSVGISTTKFRLGERGYFFKVEMENTNSNEFTRISQLIMYYRPTRVK